MNVLMTSAWPLPHQGYLSHYVGTVSAKLHLRGDHVELLATDPTDSEQYYVSGTSIRWSKQKQAQELDKAYGDAVFRRWPLLPDYIWREELAMYSYYTLGKTMELGRFDVIHAQDVMAARIMGMIRVPGSRLVLTVHSDLADEKIAADALSSSSLEIEYWTTVTKMGVAASDITIVPSETLRRRLITDYDGDPSRIVVIPYGIDPRRYPAASLPASTNSSEPIVLFVGPLDRDHGILTLIRAMSQMDAAIAPFPLWIIGTVPLGPDILRATQQTGWNERIRVLSKPTDIVTFLTQASLVVILGDQAEFLMTGLEAMACRLPIIAARGSAVSELIDDGVTGLLVPPDNPQMLARALNLILNAPVMRRKMGDAAYTSAAGTFSHATMSEEIFKQYQPYDAVRANPHVAAIPDLRLLKTIMRTHERKR
jgi:glycosyltransferase involved in cell wall biosynthesis